MAHMFPLCIQFHLLNCVFSWWGWALGYPQWEYLGRPLDYYKILLLEGETPLEALWEEVCVSQCAGLTLHAFHGYLLWAGWAPPGWGGCS